MDLLEEMSVSLQRGRAPKVRELVARALEEGLSPRQILEDGLMPGMNVIGEQFKNNQVYVPQVLVAARAMNAGVEVLKPHLASAGVQARGTVVIGTVKGDLHDIGKNLVKLMLEGKGLRVVDLGVDVAPETFVEEAQAENADIIACSALLTTTMDEMRQVVVQAEQAGIRDKVKILIGGAPVNQEFCSQIGADYYTPDAASAADVALEICRKKN